MRMYASFMYNIVSACNYAMFMLASFLEHVKLLKLKTS